MPALGPLQRHVALVGFMGAGKSTLAAEVALRIGRPFLDLDDEIERRTGSTSSSSSAPASRASASIEEEIVCETLERLEPHVLALGGGAVLSERTRRAAARARDHVFVPIARRRGVGASPRLRSPARAGPRPVRGAVGGAAAALRAGRRRRRARRRRHRPRRRGRPRRARRAAPARRASSPATAASRSSAIRTSPASTAWTRSSRSARASRRRTSCRSARRRRRSRRSTALWHELRLDRSGTIVALGGGCTTDAAGLRRRDLSARHRLGAGADEPRRAGRRGDRRQDGDRPAAGQEPRRRVPLARAHGRSTPRCSRRCRRSSGARAWRRSSRRRSSPASRSTSCPTTSSSAAAPPSRPPSASATRTTTPTASS